MNPLAERFDIKPDELALYFHTNAGVGADDLGTFLKRAATVARREGAEIRVIGFEHGSLAVLLKTIKKSKVYKAAKKEFLSAPIKTTKEATLLVGAVAGALIWAFNVDDQVTTPLARAGLAVREECAVTQIDLVTVDNIYVLLDDEKAEKLERANQNERSQIKADRYLQASEDALRGTLEGSVVDIENELHFRPDGFRFLVPIDLNRSEAHEDLFPKAHFRIRGELVTHNGRPDSIIVHSATRV